jgi:hypothetical protein
MDVVSAIQKYIERIFNDVQGMKILLIDDDTVFIMDIHLFI